MKTNLELLDLKLISPFLSNDNIDYLEKIIIFDEVNSTSTYLTELPKKQRKNITICLAESQTQGKGRLGKNWVSPFAQNIYLSLSWLFSNTSLQALSGLSIAVAVGASNALKDYGIKNIELKWPNDILWQQKKLVGILTEISREDNNVYRAVIGIGINVNMSDEAADKISQPWTDIARITNTIPHRNKLTGLMLNQLLNTLKIYEQKYLAPFLPSWQKLDTTLNKNVTLVSANTTISGTSLGINTNGCLLLQTQNGDILEITAGEISLKK